MSHAEKARDVIISLKKVRAENGYSHQRIFDMVEANGGSVSLATIKRIFADGSEDQNFRYEDSIKPIAAVLLDINSSAVAQENSSEVAALKAIILAKDEAIESEKAKVAYLKADIARKDSLLDERWEYMRRKDRQISVYGIITVFFVVYLLIFDIPNANYGLTHYLLSLFS